MIKTKGDLLKYLNEDFVALGLHKSNKILFIYKNLIVPNYIYKFQKLLRLCEYHKNNSEIMHKILFVFYYFYFVRLSAKLGFSIPLNVFGPGLCIVHYGTIVVSANAKVGANCRIHSSTCIGAAGGKKEAPTIGNNVYIGPGAKLYGNIIIGNNIAIAPNAAVGSSFTDENILIGGVPARYIKNFDISSLIKHIKK